ncbi:Abi family protein [Aerococcus sp. UMB8608]|uniref:Abi family protein n=2 Tax=Aerococcus sanguinicola TaxID=119206 RepID=A0A0X8F9J8_9LACT|nr:MULTISPECIES: Abi family protein [Aerococcus]AMB93290.1 hypothetical protein AWM72_00140 [Aerococcus sanguinicola]MDK6679389.1 Abi family protein [Aerococcus sp. UMB8608]MDK6685769.1 Abi family protein [Aerococcus sp. UMB8623]OFT95922.1 hypothetical protein HMPREF3090_03620 [Aerococcus sp. HMSC23C02]
MSYDRPFLSYEEQLQRLKDKNVIITNDEFVLKSLRTHSYYTLLNGYKDLFDMHFDQNKGMEVFTYGIDFNQLHYLYVLDTNLNTILFKYILQIERSLKTKVAHLVAEHYGVHQDNYLNYRNYSSHNGLDRLNEMRNLQKQLNRRNRNASVDHYRNNHNHIPPWIAVNVFYFGSVINWYKILNSDLKIEIANEFLDYFDELTIDDRLTLLSDSLSLIQSYRNNMAHGNRTFETSIQTELPKNEILKILPSDTLSETEFLQNLGKKDLFAVMLCIIFLIEDEYIVNNFLQDITNLLETLTKDGETQEHIISNKGNIFSTLKIPDNIRERLISLIVKKYNILYV